MEFDKEALELLQQTAVKAAGAQDLRIPGEKHQHFCVGGELRTVDVPPPVRRHAVDTLADLVRLAASFKAAGGQAVLWHSRVGVTLICDDTDRRDLAIFHLHYSPQWRTLTKLEADRPALDQRQFLRLLRLDLGAPEEVLGTFRRMEWRTGKTAQAEIAHGKESLGTSIEAQINGSFELPQSLRVLAPIYLNPGEGEIYEVLCLLDFDPINARVALVPQPGEMTRVEDLHQARLGERIADELARQDPAVEIPVYAGVP